jgi:PHD/YefM family antitoxin component YafN of YafNO toxin-antitoxin module
MSTADVHYISDEKGDLTAVIVPIGLWREIVSEFETQYLLRSEAMKKRLLEARRRDERIGLDAVLDRLGIE